MKKRVQIFHRDNWRCRSCGIWKVKLNAHHLYYDINLKIWEYDNEALVTLCDKCHDAIHQDLKKLGGIIAFKIISGEIDITELKQKPSPSK